jgi:hypothetical protein
VQRVVWPAAGDAGLRVSPIQNFSDISKITLDPIQFRYIYNSDITKQELKTQCLDVIINTTAVTWVTMAVITAATRSASTAMKALTVAAAAWAGSSTTATCAWSF